MTRFSFQVTLGGTAQNFATVALSGTSGVSFPTGWTAVYGSSYLPAVRIEMFVAAGGTGHAYIGNSSVSSTSNSYDLPPGATGLPGQIERIEFPGRTSDLASFWALGSNSGDKLTVTYYQD